MRVSLLGVPSASVHGEKVLMVQQTAAARRRRSRAARQPGSVGAMASHVRLTCRWLRTCSEKLLAGGAGSCTAKATSPVVLQSMQ